MSKKKKRQEEEEEKDEEGWLHSDTKKSIWAVITFAFAILLIFAGFHKAGPAGEFIYNIFSSLFGWGYFILPISLLLTTGALVFAHRKKFMWLTFLGALLFVLSFLGIIEIFQSGHGGWLGMILGSLKHPFGTVVATVLNLSFFIIAILVTLNIPIRLKLPEKKIKPIITGEEENPEPEENEEESESSETEDQESEENAPEDEEVEEKESIIKSFGGILPTKKRIVAKIKNYIPPPLDLLKSSTEKPTTGDLRANANIIKRTLESFGIQVEMGEINIGPKVTRYTLKPAEGIKLSRITALNQDLSLALATHPIRIEAPIPGRSLVGIEVPNKSAALVRLGSLIIYPEFQASGSLGFALGRNVSGDPIFASIDKMPHLLVAGATGSGKSITIHSILISLLYKNSPSTLKMILVDPKRVELSCYDGLPHLAAPVITQNKKAVGALRWAISEMDRRYEILLKAGRRDIKGYNETDPEEPMPYLLIVVDELADLMTSYGRDVEGYIVRLAQMARATGIHLILSTQRPSVEVITGLIKANITSRIALQVASQIDSRTILDTSGAEKLLGGGDLLFVSAELSKPKRIQGAYLTEDEMNKVINFIKENNEPEITEEEIIGEAGETASPSSTNVLANFDAEPEEGDEMYDEAVEMVRESGKASASYLQRRLKVGYARAARLLDLMENNGLIGPGDGAKAREIYLEKVNDDFKQPEEP